MTEPFHLFQNTHEYSVITPALWRSPWKASGSRRFPNGEEKERKRDERRGCVCLRSSLCQLDLFYCQNSLRVTISFFLLLKYDITSKTPNFLWAASHIHDCSFRRSLFPNFRPLNTFMHTSGLKTWNRILVFLRCFWTVWICDCSTCSCTGPQHRCYTTVQHRNLQNVRVAALPELRLSLLEILYERGNKNQKKTKSQTRFVWHTATPRQRLDTTCLFFKTSWPRLTITFIRLCLCVLWWHYHSLLTGLWSVQVVQFGF